MITPALRLANNFIDLTPGRQRPEASGEPKWRSNKGFYTGTLRASLRFADEGLSPNFTAQNWSRRSSGFASGRQSGRKGYRSRGRPAEARDFGKPAPPVRGEENGADGRLNLVLEAGDFIDRIPHHLLKFGSFDLHRPLLFDMGEIANRIARGIFTIPLADLLKVIPEMFADDAQALHALEIRFPWQKVMQMVTESAVAQKENGEKRSRRNCGACARSTNRRRRPRKLRPKPGAREISSAARVAIEKAHGLPKGPSHLREESFQGKGPRRFRRRGAETSGSSGIGPGII